eukprot:jgi/Astpho2/3520/Aster-06433
MEGPSDERKDYASDQPREIGDAELDFLAQYTGHQDRARLRQHVLATWQQAKDDGLFIYKCINDFYFLKPSICDHPFYAEVKQTAQQAREGTSLAAVPLHLDIGCCLGQDTRRLILDGWPQDRVVAIDLVPDYWRLGLKLFMDESKISAQICYANMSEKGATSTPPAASLKGKTKFVWAGLVLHCLTKEQVDTFLEQVCNLLMPGGTFYGSTVGADPPTDWGATNDGTAKRYVHSGASLKAALHAAGFSKPDIVADTPVEMNIKPGQTNLPDHASPLSIKTQPGDGLEGSSAESSASPGSPDAKPHSPRKRPRDSTDEQVELSKVSGTSSAASGSGFSRSQHFDPDQDAILRLECLSGRRLKVMIWFKNLMKLGSIIFITLVASLEGTNNLQHPKNLLAASIAIAAGCMALLMVGLARLAHSCQRVNREHKYWSKRRWRCTALVGVFMALELLNLSFWLVSSSLGLHKCNLSNSFCPWSYFIQWTLFNCLLVMTLMMTHNGCAWTDKAGTPRQHLWFCGNELAKMERRCALVLDAPWRAHLPKLFWWCILQASICLRLAVSLTGPLTEYPAKSASHISHCLALERHCSTGHTSLGMAHRIVGLVALSLYLVPHMVYVKRGQQDLRHMPYTAYRLGRTLMRLNVSDDMGSGGHGFLCVGLLLCLVFESGFCDSCFQTFILAAVHSKLTTLGIVGVYLYEPISTSPEDPQILQIWLQMFAWSEATKPRVLWQRATGGSHQRSLMEREPLFCMETAIKMLYFSGMAYEHDEHQHWWDESAAVLAQPPHANISHLQVPSADSALSQGREELKLSEDTAMQLYGLKQLRVVREEKLDTKCFLAWNEDILVLAFRGTASTRNAISDLQVCFPSTMLQPPTLAWLTHLEDATLDVDTGSKKQRRHSRVKVHRGFHTSWRLNGMREKVVDLIRSEVCPDEAAARRMKVLFTGHSLGGALAMLAAFDLAPVFPWGSVEVHTIGAPRPGNAAFAKAYNERLPSTWHIINHKDPVPHMGKFWKAYKRPGQRVLIDAQGDMIVRPSALDMRLGALKGCGSAKQHYLAAYRSSMVVVVKTQLTHSKFDDGLEGVLQLAESIPLQDTLLAADLDVSRETNEIPTAMLATSAAIDALPL